MFTRKRIRDSDENVLYTLNKLYFYTFGFDAQVLKDIPDVGYVISAGGSVLQCMTNLKWETDVDLYCCTKKTEQVLKDFFKTRGYEQTQEYSSAENPYKASGFMMKNKLKNIVTLSNTPLNTSIQIIRGEGNEDATFDAQKRTVKKILDNFDLNICSIGYEFHTGTIIKSDDLTLTELYSKTMTLRENYFDLYSQSNYILHCRILKYQERGFTLLNPQPLYSSIISVKRALNRLKLYNSRIENIITVNALYPKKFKETVSKLFKFYHIGKLLIKYDVRLFEGYRLDSDNITLKDLVQLQSVINAKIDRLYEKQNQYFQGNPLLYQNKIEKFESLIKWYNDNIIYYKLAVKRYIEDIINHISKESSYYTQADAKPYIDFYNGDLKKLYLNCTNADDTEMFTQTPISDLEPESLFHNIILKESVEGYVIERVMCYDLVSLRTWIAQNNTNPTFPDTQGPVSPFKQKLISKQLSLFYASSELKSLEQKLFKIQKTFVDYQTTRKDTWDEKALILAGGKKRMLKTKSAKFKSRTRKYKKSLKKKAKSMKRKSKSRK